MTTTTAAPTVADARHDLAAAEAALERLQTAAAEGADVTVRQLAEARDAIDLAKLKVKAARQAARQTRDQQDQTAAEQLVADLTNPDGRYATLVRQAVDTHDQLARSAEAHAAALTSLRDHHKNTVCKARALADHLPPTVTVPPAHFYSTLITVDGMQLSEPGSLDIARPLADQINTPRADRWRRYLRRISRTQTSQP